MATVSLCTGEASVRLVFESRVTGLSVTDVGTPESEIYQSSSVLLVLLFVVEI